MRVFKEAWLTKSLLRSFLRLRPPAPPTCQSVGGELPRLALGDTKVDSRVMHHGGLALVAAAPAGAVAAWWRRTPPLRRLRNEPVRRE